MLEEAFFDLVTITSICCYHDFHEFVVESAWRTQGARGALLGESGQVRRVLAVDWFYLRVGLRAHA